MNKRVLIPIAMLGSFAALAADDLGRSIMFTPDTSRDYLTQEPGTAPGAVDKCDQLAKEVQGLKGKPQRRFAAEQRYQAECVRPSETYSKD
jgi:hypothetical protein